jgi:hypothetical protein
VIEAATRQHAIVEMGGSAIVTQATGPGRPSDGRPTGAPRASRPGPDASPFCRPILGLGSRMVSKSAGQHTH